MGDQVERDVINTKPPDKVIDIPNVLLVRLGGKDSLEKPSPVMNLAGITDFFKGQNGLLHNWNLLWAVLNLFYCNRVDITGVDNTLVIPNWNPYPALIKHAPVFLHKVSKRKLSGRIQMRQVELLTKALSMKSFVKGKVKCRVGYVKRRRQMLQLPQDRSTVNVVQQHIILVRLVGESPIIDENFLQPMVAFMLAATWIGEPLGCAVGSGAMDQGTMTGAAM